LPTFEQALFQPFKFILQQDIDRMLYSLFFLIEVTVIRTEYVPYVFQVLASAQMLDLQKKGPSSQ
jgi:hypothetical protein